MNTRKIVRPADITVADAQAQIKEAGLELVSIRLIDDSGKKIASADAVGRSDLSWEATVKVAEFPFTEDGEDEAPKDESPVGEPSEDPIGDEDKDEDHEESEEKADEKADSKILDLVKEIAKHLGIPTGDEDPMGDVEGDAGLGDPIVDVPVGDEIDKQAPLPLPVEKKAPGMGGGTFASHIVVANADAVKGRRSFVACVAEAHVMNDGEIVNEAHIAFPGYRVAGRIDRKTLAESNEARVPMVAKAKAE